MEPPKSSATALPNTVATSSAAAAAEGGASDSADGPSLPTAGTAPLQDRIKNPFATHGRAGRLPFLSKQLVGRKVSVGREMFNRRSMMYLREFQQTCNLRPELYPLFLKSGRTFSILVDGHRLNFSEILGYGRFGIVFKATIEGDGEGSGLQVAVKFMFNERPHVRGWNSEEFKKARKLPQKLFDSGRIIYYLALVDMAKYMNSEAELIIMELAENGDLFDSIVSASEGAETQTPMVYCANHARRLTVMVIEAMATLRSHGYLHRDLKAENLLFNKQGQMVLGDIGNIKDLEGGSAYREMTVLGSDNTMAPEVKRFYTQKKGQGLYDCEKSDIWSIGCIHFQLRSCLPLLDTHVLKAKIEDFTEGTATTGANARFWAKWEKWHKGIAPGGKYAKIDWTHDYRTEDFSLEERNFLNALLVRDFKKRPTLAELIDAVRGKRGANPMLSWLGQAGVADGDTNHAFEKEMSKRIAGYGKNKNMVAWPYSGGEASGVTPEQYMEQVAEVMRNTISTVVDKFKYASDIKDLSKTTKAANFIQIQVTITTQSVTEEGPGQTVRIIVEIEKPSAELKGCITFVRKSGEAALYLQLLQQFAKRA